MLTIPNQQKEVGWHECIDLIPKEEEIDWTKVPYGALVELSGSVYIDGGGISLANFQNSFPHNNEEPRICKFVGYDDGYVVLDVSEYSTDFVYNAFHTAVCRLVEGGCDV